MSLAPPDVRVARVAADVVRPLRAAVLRPGLPLAESVYPEDDDPATRHLAAIDPAGAVVGCATFFPEPRDGAPGWRLRGMATHRERRGCGIGSALLRAGLAAAADAGVALVWCNARTSAVGFYERFGFVVSSAEFLTAGGIPHVVMTRPVPPQQ